MQGRNSAVPPPASKLSGGGGFPPPTTTGPSSLTPPSSMSYHQKAINMQSHRHQQPANSHLMGQQSNQQQPSWMASSTGSSGTISFSSFSILCNCWLQCDQFLGLVTIHNLLTKQYSTYLIRYLFFVRSTIFHEPGDASAAGVACEWLHLQWRACGWPSFWHINAKHGPAPSPAAGSLCRLHCFLLQQHVPC